MSHNDTDCLGKGKIYSPLRNLYHQGQATFLRHRKRSLFTFACSPKWLPFIPNRKLNVRTRSNLSSQRPLEEKPNFL